MKISFRPILATLVLGAAGVSMMNSASAGCGFEPPAPTPTIRAPTMQQPSALRQMVYRPGSDGARFVLTSDELGRHNEPSIVGMWRFELIAPDGSTADDGYAVWHADGTEIQNSGVHAPPTSNFCLGVYERVGDRTYELNHFPLGWDASGQASAVAIQLTETVKLTDNDHMTGTFTIKVYPWDSTKGLTVLSSMPVQTVTGTLTAERVTLASKVPGAQ
jgi:hypothetical protein